MDGTEDITATADRRAWMGLLARARPDALAACAAALGEMPQADWLRPPETGAVMVRGRMGGTGAPFNLGEMTVTRCALRLATGEVGHACVQGRDRAHARRAALCDALLQGGRADEVRRVVLDPLAGAEADRRASRAGKAAATKVDFFTLARGED
ncbi:phosphonate C-P lyase system protein PhnG [Roseivivax isoporae]|uniref:Enzyme of phosphonate metabolism protein PhnG n=1 Tax=Roseivivax isoporae LMG 25204 TaxID=1449351 RepID=X7F4A3_9RHOB|nr:phosphonate C-P lyase system protein PhnG [Roseivivax isoporae]ETX27752.1 enzyme of phosphonate metabolism protein PhnG [Roseivivax isoporae LMG 25204]